MATPVSISNLALSHIGHAATVSAIDPPETSYEAQLCGTFFPIARDNILEMANWSFATKRVALTELGTNPSDRWAFAYGYPADVLKPLGILLPETARALPLVWSGEWLPAALMSSPDMQRYPFIVEATDTVRAIFTDVESAVLLYTAKSADTGKWTSLFTTAVSFQLGAYLAGPLTKDPRITSAMYQAAAATLGTALVTDANARNFNPYDRPPGAVAARA